jgi:hypothetical protein
MSAGTGVLHSEQNPSRTGAVHFLQIWILPEKQGLAPSYEQKTFPEAEKRGKLRLLGSRDGRDGSITVHQDVALYGTVLAPGERVEYGLGQGRHAWVQVTRGGITLNGNPLRAGDGAALSDVSALELVGDGEKAEVLLFDLA